MKNWLPFVSGPLFAIASRPSRSNVCLRSVSFTNWYPGPPVPSPSGSPPWITNPGRIRWNVSPSKNPSSARNTKLATACGATSANSSSTTVPHDVSIVAV